MGTGIAIVAARHAQVDVLALDKFDASLERSAGFVKGCAFGVPAEVGPRG